MQRSGRLQSAGLTTSTFTLAEDRAARFPKEPPPPNESAGQGPPSREGFTALRILTGSEGLHRTTIEPRTRQLGLPAVERGSDPVVLEVAAAKTDSLDPLDQVVERLRPPLTWTGRTVPIAGFPTELRSEDAIHRWDLVGDDAISHELLSQHDLFIHAVNFIGHPLLAGGLAANGDRCDPIVGRVRS